jgi:hypothetical protein
MLDPSRERVCDLRTPAPRWLRAVAALVAIMWGASGAAGRHATAGAFDADPLAAASVATVGQAEAGPPMYIPDPGEASGFAAMPVALAGTEIRDWPRWFAGASGLVMTRTLPSGSGSGSWPGGVDLHLGRWFGPQQHHAVEFIYWGVFNIESSQETTSDLVGGTIAQTASRSDIVNDVEINWVYSLWERPEFLPRDRAVNLMWLAGFRYFGLSDAVQFRTLNLPGGPGFNEATADNIFGGQVGAKFDWMFLPRFRLAVVPKFMIGGNSITNTITSINTPVSERSTLGVFSWLGSVDTGLAWDVTDRWSLSLGYRVVGVGNIAQADGLPAAIDADSSTIVHGGFAGFEGRY